MVTPVQTVTASAATTSTSVVATISGVAAGNTLVIVGAANGMAATASVTSITDSSGNTVTIVATKTPGTLTTAVATGAYVLNAASGSHTITINLSSAASAGGSIIVREYRQFDLFVFDKHVENTGTVDNPMTSTASPSTTQPYENVICWCARMGSTVPTVGTGFANFTLINGPSNNCQSVLEDMTVTTIGAQTGTVVDTSPTNYACGVMTFKSKLVQTPFGTGSSGTSSVVTTLTATGAGNFLVVGWATAVSTSTTITSVIDSAGNNWTSAYSQLDVTGNASGLYYLPSATNAGGITSVTITFGQTQSGSLAQVREYTALQAPVTILDKTTNALSSANPATSGATTSTTQNTEIVLGLANTVSGSSAPNWTVGTGFFNYLLSQFDFAGPATLFIAIEEKEVSTTGTQTALFGNPSVVSTGTAVATFKEVSGSTNNNNLLLLRVG